MPDIIDAGANGVLTEELFSEALKVNDALVRTLEAEKTGTRIAVDDDAPPKPASTANLLDFDDSDSSSPAPAKTEQAATPSKVQAALLDLDDDSAGLDYKPNVKRLSNNFQGAAIKPVGHHGGSQYSATPLNNKPPSGDPVFTSTSASDIDLLLTEDKPKESKTPDDFDAFLDSIGASSIK
jgi:hypothetical protein